MIHPDSLFRISLKSGPTGPFFFGPYTDFQEASKLMMDHLDILIAIRDIKTIINPLDLEICIEEFIYNSTTNEVEIIDVRARDTRTSTIRIHN